MPIEGHMRLMRFMGIVYFLKKKNHLDAKGDLLQVLDAKKKMENEHLGLWNRP